MSLAEGGCPFRGCLSLPGIFFWGQSDVPIGSNVNLTVLRLDAYAEELDVLRGICTHPRVVLQGGYERRKTHMDE